MGNGSFSNPSIREKLLKGLLNKDVKVFMATGHPVCGKLLEYDKDSLVVSHRTSGCEPVLVNYEQVCTVTPDDNEYP